MVTLTPRVWKKIIGLFGLMALVVSSVAAVGLSAKPAQAAACAPSADFGQVSFSQAASLPAGSYKIWVRMEAADTTNNAVFVQINDSSNATQCFKMGDDSSIPSAAGQWKWVDYQNGSTTAKVTVNLPTTSTLAFKLIGAEPGVKVDRVLFLSSTDTCVPSNTRDTTKTPPVEPGDNCTQANPPSVSINSPANNASFQLGSNGAVDVPLSVNAAASTGASLTKVEYYNNAQATGTPVATSTTAPYSSSWHITAAGTYTLVAKAYDNQNNSTVSAPVTFTVKAALGQSSVAITSPANNANFTAPATFTLVATPTTDTTNGVTPSKVQFFQNGNALANCVVTASPWQCTVSNLPAGSGTASASYQFTAQLTDSANRTVTSSAITVTVSPKPTIVINTPADGSTINVPATVAVTATPTVGQGRTVNNVTFTLDGVQVGSPDTTSPYTTSINLSTAKDYTLVAKVTDSAGATATATALLHGKSTCTTPPNPPGTLQGSVTAAHTAALSWTAATATCNGVKGYNVYRVGSSGPINGSVPVTTTNYTDSNVAAGQSYTYSVTAVDNSTPPLESAHSGSVTVNIPQSTDKTPPTTPTGLAQTGFSASSVAFKWNPSTDPNPGNGEAVSGLAGYHVTRVNDNHTVDVPASPTPSFTDTGLQPNITYVYQVVAFDNANNGSSAAQISIKTASAPTAVITAPNNGDQFTAPANVTVNVTAQAFDGLQVSKVDVVNCSNQAQVFGTDTTAPYSVSVNNLAAGSYCFQARVTDSAGDAALSTPVNVTVFTAGQETIDLTAAPGPYYGRLSVNGTQVFGGNSITLMASPHPASGHMVSKVEIFAGGQSVGLATLSNGTYNLTLQQVPVGDYSYTAVLTTNANTTATSPVLAEHFRIPGDANDDTTVQIADLAILSKFWNTTNVDPRSDFNRDSSVTIIDLAILSKNWNYVK